jgi:nucleoside-diphosphate-sugar epimerase
MKRVLITGSNSYVGTNVEKWLLKEPENFQVETISVRGDLWKSFDFSKFDVVFHVAGIAHISYRKSMKKKYFSVNRDLAFEVAKKSKDTGVKQFIFMSSMIVYNSKETRITKDTIPNPDNYYGRSKVEAEFLLRSLHSDDFHVSIIRAPMIYGYESSGNFTKLLQFLLKYKFFPRISNIKSVIFIDNFSNFVKNLIENSSFGLFYPQNNEYFNFIKFAEYVSQFTNNKITLIRIPFFRILFNIKYFKKIFGDFYYDNKLKIESKINDNPFTFERSIKRIIDGFDYD